MRGLFLVPVGFVVAILSAAVVLTFAALWPFFGPGPLGAIALITAWRFAQLAIVPVLLGVAVGEFLRLRSPAYWITLWVAFALAAQALPWMAFGDARWRIVLYAIAGLIAGSLYWLIAGRGIFRAPPAAPRPAHA